jgi:hypothetical protein
MYLRYSPLLGLGRFFQLLDHIHSRYDPLDGGSARRKASTYTHSNTNTEQMHTIQTSMLCVEFALQHKPMYEGHSKNGFWSQERPKSLIH